MWAEYRQCVMKYLVGIFLVILILCSCERKVSKNILSGTDVDMIAMIDTVDTIIVDTVDVDTLPPHKYFRDSISALKFVKSEEYRNSYNGSIIPQMIKDYFPYAQKLLNSKYQRFIVVDKYNFAIFYSIYCRRWNCIQRYKVYNIGIICTINVSIGPDGK